MDVSGFALVFYVGCAGICIPTMHTGSIYAIISFIPKENRNVALIKDKLIIILAGVFIIAFILTCALLLYWTKDFYVM